ncbi:MAG: type IV conjugative transfer system protein TraL [Arcobacter sp.]|nr:type IV conjugative transfer system protein TraL [Arcobacter sp.]|tara:strand:- start:8715 stop:9014 length:300 start_codon:yes stop_codon:yes gene_type:complete
MNEDSKYIDINKYIDTMPMVMNWEMDSFIIAVGSAGFAIIFSGIFVYLSLFFGISFLIINEKIKDTKYKSYLTHILYMLGLKKPKSNRLPKSELRVFVG